MTYIVSYHTRGLYRVGRLKRGTLTPTYKELDSSWTEAEEQELRDAVASYGTKWKAIKAAGILVKRNERMLSRKW